MQSPFQVLFVFLLSFLSANLNAEAKIVDTPYQSPKVVYDIYLDDPQKMASALYWIRSLMNPLMDDPYSIDPEFMDIVVVIHGTEIVTVAKKNYKKYKDIVGRMQYYAHFGIKFKVCGLAAHDYDYSAGDFHDFIELVPSAITELVHWQQKGYAIITPNIMDKKFSIDEIR
ncbi:MAG: DsrE family protein [Gammaproteobacteria bacterium]